MKTRILGRLDRLRSLAPQVLMALPVSSCEVERIEGRKATLNTYRDETETGAALIVVQGFLHSWRFPTYIGSEGVGYRYAEGIVVNTDRSIGEPEEELMWFYR